MSRSELAQFLEIRPVHISNLIVFNYYANNERV